MPENIRVYALQFCLIKAKWTLLFHKWQLPVSIRSVWQLHNMYSTVHIPLYHRCTKIENFQPITCRHIPHFVKINLVLVRLWRHALSNLYMSKTKISRKRDKISRNRERLSYSFRNYNLLRSKLNWQFCLRTLLKYIQIEIWKGWCTAYTDSKI